MEPAMPKRSALCLTLCLLLLGTALCGPARADELTEAKRADIRKLMDITGSGALGKQFAGIMTKQMVETLRRSRPDIPARTLDIVQREVTALISEKLDGPGGMLDRMVPLYAAAFSHQEIRDILAFYQTPTGKKAIAAMPALLRDGQKIGADMAKEIIPELKQRLKTALSNEGVVLDKLPD
jgi:hypothetical protein